MLGAKKLMALIAVGTLTLGVLTAGATKALAVTADDWSTSGWTTSYYNNLTNQETANAFGSMFGLSAGILATVAIVAACVGLVAYLYMAITLMVTAKKVGEPNAWLAFIPIANLYLMNKVAGLESWMFLLFLVPLVNAVYGIYLYMKIAERRGFENWVGLLVLVPFIGIFIPAYIAWGTPSGAAPVAAQPAGPVAAK